MYRDLFEALEDLYKFYTFANYENDFLKMKINQLQKSKSNYGNENMKYIFGEDFKYFSQFLNNNNANNNNNYFKILFELLKKVINNLNIQNEKDFEILKKTFPYKTIISIINQKKMKYENFKVMHMSKTYFNKLFLIGYSPQRKTKWFN